MWHHRHRHQVITASVQRIVKKWTYLIMHMWKKEPSKHRSIDLSWQSSRCIAYLHYILKSNLTTVSTCKSQYARVHVPKIPSLLFSRTIECLQNTNHHSWLLCMSSFCHPLRPRLFASQKKICRTQHTEFCPRVLWLFAEELRLGYPTTAEGYVSAQA